MKRTLCLLLAAIMALALVGCGDTSAQPTGSTQQSENTEGESTSTEQPQATEKDFDGDDQSSVLFESDKVVDRLLKHYNQIAEYPIKPDEISKGNIRSKPLVSYNNLYIEIINSRNGFASISINDSQDKEKCLYAVFRDFLFAIDSNISSDTISTAWNDIQATRYEIDYSGNSAVETYDVNGIQLQYLESDLYGHETSVDILYETD